MRYRAALLLVAVMAVTPATARADTGVTAAVPPVVGLPGELTAGSTLPVTVGGAAGVVTLTVLAPWGTAVRTADPVDGVATFALPPEITRGTGTLTLIADSGGQIGTGSVTVLPGPAVGPLLPVVGARSVVADGTDRSMVVAIPVDEWGNAIADGSAVTVVHRDPTGLTSTADATMAHLLGWLELPSGTVAGRGQVWLQAGPNGAVTGQQVSLDEVAGPPLPFTVTAVDPTQPGRLGADGQNLLELRTSVLTDRFGNVQPDGTLVTVEWRGPAGPARASAVTISGVAELSVQAPTLAGTVTVTASARGTATAAPLEVVYPAVVTDVPVDSRVDERGLVVTVGPVNRTGGTYVPDGTAATVVLTDRAGHTVSAAAGLVDGSVVQLLPTSAMVGAYTVTVAVLGAVTTMDVG